MPFPVVTYVDYLVACDCLAIEFGLTDMRLLLYGSTIIVRSKFNGDGARSRTSRRNRYSLVSSRNFRKDHSRASSLMRQSGLSHALSRLPESCSPLRHITFTRSRKRLWY